MKVRRETMLGRCGVRRFASLLAATLALFAGAEAARAAAPAPWLLERALGTAKEASVRENIRRWTELRAGGVDKVHQEFALDPARYPRGGVARRNILVVLAQFPSDQYGGAVKPSSQSTPGYYQKIFFSEDPDDGITSVREYYREASNGRLLISGQVTSKWIDMPNSYAYYVNSQGGLDFDAYPRSAQALAEHAMGAAVADFGENLGYFDNDGPDGVSNSGDDDGYIDAVCVIHPGVGAEVATDDPYEFMWSHEAGLRKYSNCAGTSGGPGCLPGLMFGGVRGFLYFMGGEFNERPRDNAIGTYCHEFGHTIGLPDLYDNVGAGLGFFSLMGLGNYLPFNGEAAFGSAPSNLDAWCRQFLGFDPIVTPSVGGNYSLGPATGGGGSLRVWTNGEPGTEYFLLENREKIGIDRYLPGDGLVIYHVDDSIQDNLGGPSAYRVRVIAADGQNELEKDPAIGGNYGDDADFWPGSLGRRTWTESTVPDSRDYAGNDTAVRLANIVGGTVDGTDSVSFDLVLSTEPDLRVVGTTYLDGGDGSPDPTETGDLTLQLRNVGTPSGAFTYTLTSLDALVTVNAGASAGAAIATGQVGTNTTPFNVTFGSPVTLPRIVTLRLAWNDGTVSGTQDFALTIGEGAGLAEDFESDFTLSGWSSAAIAPSAFNEWHRTQVRVHGGGFGAKVGSTNALGTGSNEQQTYRSNQDAGLVSPGFNLPVNSQVTFWSYVDTETNGGTGAWDGGRLEISLLGGPWIPVTVDDDYPYMIEFNAGTSLAGSSVVAGSSGGWKRFVADLSAYSGPARIRFRFASDDTNEPRNSSGALVRYYEGWYVDDVTVAPRQTPGPTPRRVTFRAGPVPYFAGTSSSGSLRFRFSARDGLPHPGERPIVRIYDVKGRLVRELNASVDPLLAHEFGAAWDGRDRAGAAAGAGVYFAKVTLLGETQTARLVVIR